MLRRRRGLTAATVLTAAIAILVVAAVAAARPPALWFSGVAERRQAPVAEIDWDRDGLSNRFEQRRSKTNPLKVDTDGDGYGDGYEVRVLRSDPRRASSPGRKKPPHGPPVRPAPPAEEQPAPPAGEQPGEEPPPPAEEPPPPAAEEPAPPAEEPPPVEEPPPAEEPPPDEPPAPPAEEPPAEEPPPPAQEPPPSVDGEIGSAAALVSAARASSSDGKTFYLRGGDYGDVDLGNVRRGALVTFLAYPGEVPRFGELSFARSQNLRFDGFRAETVAIEVGTSSSYNRQLQFANCTLGGRAGKRINPLAVFSLYGYSEDISIEGCDIGWTAMNGVEDNGNGVRAVNGDNGPIRRLSIRDSRIHHVSCDAIQLAGNSEFLLDRTEIAYVAPQPGYGCHADSLQNLGFSGDASRITNNYIHHVGYYDENHKPSGGDPAGQLIYHNNGGGALIENNLFTDNRNYALNLGSGCGGCPSSLRNVIVRGNTIVRSGTAFGGESAPDLRWAPKGGTGNRFERNVIGSIAADGSLAPSVVAFSGNVYTDETPIGPTDLGPVKLSFDAAMNCTSPSCADAGYRKPPGVDW